MHPRDDAGTVLYCPGVRRSGQAIFTSEMRMSFGKGANFPRRLIHRLARISLTPSSASTTEMPRWLLCMDRRIARPAGFPRRVFSCAP